MSAVPSSLRWMGYRARSSGLGWGARMATSVAGASRTEEGARMALPLGATPTETHC